MLQIQSSSRGETKIFYIYTTKKYKKIFIFILCLKSNGRYRLYLPIPILLADTTKIGRYHRCRYLSIGTSLVLTVLQLIDLKVYHWVNGDRNSFKTSTNRNFSVL